MRRVTKIAMTLGVLLVAPALAADEASNSSPKAAELVFLLSERDLGTGFKVCFLSNGMQLRRPVSQSCPSPTPVPSPAPEQPEKMTQGPSTANSMVSVPLQNSGSVKARSANLLPLPATQEPALVTTGAEMSLPAAEPAEQPKPTPKLKVANPAVSPASKENKLRAEPPVPLLTSAGELDDPIADKALKRCIMIGFERGTDQFRTCSLEQIRILSNYR